MGQLFNSSIEFDDRQMKKFLRKHFKELSDDLEEEFKDQVQEVETGTKALMPKDEGNLEDSVHKTDVKNTGQSLEADIKVGGTGTKYAARMHEDVYTPGEVTKGKPNYKGYTPGRKYLENALKANEKEFMDRIEKVVKKNMSR